ncbi:MAG: FtsX-like permease family protein [Bacteroidota bacterium]
MKAIKKYPPKYPLRFFRWFCHPEFVEDLEGDLRERYVKKTQEKSLLAAKWGLVKDVIRLFRPGIIRSFISGTQLNNFDMFRNYLKVAYRNLSKDRAFSTLNILGLTIGIIASVFIFRYVGFERSYDRFHTKSKGIYRLAADIDQGEIVQTTMTKPPMGPGLKKNFPEVIDFTRLILPWSGQGTSSTLNWENEVGKETKHSFHWGFYTDPGFLSMFSFPMIKGDRSTALKGVNKIILSESSARKIFGNNWKSKSDIIGQTVEYVNEFDRFSLTITGIIADAPENSHFQYDFLASFSTLSTGWAKGYAETWDGNDVYTYLELAPSANTTVLTRNAEIYYVENSGNNLASKTSFELQSLSSIYLTSNRQDELKINANSTYLSFLYFIAVAILLIAVINYVNLTTAKAVQRGHEVGLRKVLGAFRLQLIKQFLMESALINGIAFSLSIIFIFAFAPYMDQVTGKSIDYISIKLWPLLILLFPAISLISGIYPAFVLSGYDPLKTLKGKLTSSKSGIYMRNYLVVFQFWVSIGLIIFTVTIYKQLNHMRYSEVGFQKEGVLVVNGPVNRENTWIEHDQQKREEIDDGDNFKDALNQYSGIKAVSLSWSIPGEKSNSWPIELGPDYDNSKLHVVDADNDYASVYYIDILAGEFSTKNGVVINQKAAKILRIENLADAIGKEFTDANGQKLRINGVVKDYHHYSLHEPIKPIMFQENDPSYKLDSYYSLRLTANNLQSKLTTVENAYRQTYPNDPFDYYFIDDYFDAQYEADVRFSKLFSIFSMLTIFIASLGLVGLALHTVNIRIKEIGIRKVLGASVGGIILILNKNTMILVGLSCLLSLPLAYWAAENWLSNYAFRIELNVSFLLPVLIAPSIVLLMVSALSYKAANINPVDTLRNE